LFLSRARERRLELRQGMTLKARVSHLKHVPAGTGLSYGLTYETGGESVIATIPAGYADGYKRVLTKRGTWAYGGSEHPSWGGSAWTSSWSMSLR
jgi:alanine racemase